MVVIIHRSHELCYYKAIFSRFETILLFCTLFLESHLINTTSPHFQLPFIDITTHYCYYHSIGILHIKWYATQLMFLLKKFFQLNHIQLNHIFCKLFLNVSLKNLFGGCIPAKTLRILCAVSRHVTI